MDRQTLNMLVPITEKEDLVKFVSAVRTLPLSKTDINMILAYTQGLMAGKNVKAS